MTFVEVVVTIVLIGVVVLPLLAAVRTAIRTSSVSRTSAEVETVLVNAADRVTRAPREGTLKCDLAGQAQAAAPADWDPITTITVEQAHWDATLGDFEPEACPDGAWENGLIQRITITVTSPDESVRRTLEVVKSDF